MKLITQLRNYDYYYIYIIFFFCLRKTLIKILHTYKFYGDFEKTNNILIGLFFPTKQKHITVDTYQTILCEEYSWQQAGYVAVDNF